MPTADFHLVVLEDSDAVALQVRTYLEGLPVTPHQVRSIAEAMGLVRQYSIDMCLVDYRLAASGETGEQFCEALVQEFGDAGLPVVLMSADLQALQALNAKFPFVFSVLPKPFTREAISQVFLKLLSELRAARAKESTEEPAAAAVEAVPMVAGVGGGGMGRSEAFRVPASGLGGAVPGDGGDDSLNDELRQLAAGAGLEGAAEVAAEDHEDEDGPEDLSEEIPDPPGEERVVRVIPPAVPRPPAATVLPRLTPPSNWALPLPPPAEPPRAAPLTLKPLSLNGAAHKAAPVATTQDSGATVPSETLLHMPVSLVGATGPLVEHILNLSRVRRCRALVLAAADGGTIRAWVDQGRFAGFSSTNVPARFRPTGLAPDLAATLVAQQQLSHEPVAAIAGTPETFEGYQRHCHAELLAMFSGIVSVVIVREIPAWCTYPDVGI